MELARGRAGRGRPGAYRRLARPLGRGRRWLPPIRPQRPQSCLPRVQTMTWCRPWPIISGWPTNLGKTRCPADATRQTGFACHAQLHRLNAQSGKRVVLKGEMNQGWKPLLAALGFLLVCGNCAVIAGGASNRHCGWRPSRRRQNSPPKAMRPLFTTTSRRRRKSEGPVIWIKIPRMAVLSGRRMADWVAARCAANLPKARWRREVLRFYLGGTPWGLRYPPGGNL